MLNKDENNLVNEFIRNLNYRNDKSYKFALGRFILDYIQDNFIIKEKEIKNTKIDYSIIAEYFLKYYWNQIILYKLKQHAGDKKPAKIFSILIELKEKDNINERYDVYFNNNKNSDLKEKLIQVISKSCFSDVIPRFQKFNLISIYNHNARQITSNKYYLPKEKSERYIILNKNSIIILKENIKLLLNSVILEWAKFLEKTNFTPKLIEKIERINNPQRNSLTKFRNILLEKERKNCFYCNKKLEKGDIHVDHFIPWSYIFDNNDWNLVLSCSKCNLKKSNSIPSKKCLVKLKENKSYLNVNNDLIDDYYNNCIKAGFTKEFKVCD